MGRWPGEFNGISTPLSIRRSILARWGPGPGPGPRDPRAKTLRPLGKRSNPLNIQRENRWQRGKSTEYSLKRLRLRDLIKGKRDFVTICHCLCYFLLVSGRRRLSGPFSFCRFFFSSALQWPQAPVGSFFKRNCFFTPANPRSHANFRKNEFFK